MKLKLFSAKDARRELLEAILSDISSRAKNGHSKYRYYEPLSKECVKSLIELGYNVKRGEPVVATDGPIENTTITNVHDDCYIISW